MNAPVNATEIRRYLVVNADDFGLSAGTSRGIIEAHERGIVTSTSLMVRQPAAAEAAAYAAGRPELSVGLHVDLGEWVFGDGEWRQAYEVAPADDAEAVAAELARQLRTFFDLMGRAPTHLDSHQHVHRDEPLRSILLRLGGELNVPVREFTPGIAFCGGFYGQAKKGFPLPEGITVENLIQIIGQLPPGVSELGCHPGLDEALESTYRAERIVEVRTLCDSRVLAGLDATGCELISFANLPRT